MRFLFNFVFLQFIMQTAIGQKNELLLLTGTYTSGKSEGIYVFKYLPDQYEASALFTATGIKNPSFLTLSKDGKYVYAVSELNHKGNGGLVVAYAFNASNGSMQKLNEQPSGGDDPCYVTVDLSNKWVIAGNYSSGTFSLIPIKKDGSLGIPKKTISHSGSGPNKSRQEKPHVHSTVLSPDNRFLFVSDLGTDQINIYRFNANKGTLQPAKQAFAAVTPGSGPRHFSFHPNGKFAYVLKEMTGSVTCFRYNSQSGELTTIQEISSLPEGFTGQAGSADIHLSPDGRFLYASNRGESHTIAIYSVDAGEGKLTLRGHQSVLGKNPRNFSLTPDGTQLIVANQSSDEMVIFKRDIQTGMLTDTGKRIKVPTPVCIAWGKN